VHPFRPLLALALSFFAVLSVGCSKDVERIVANERLLRGQGDIGSTDRAVYAANRDTYVGVGQRNFGNTLLVGQEGSYQAESFVRVLVWGVPADPNAIIDSVYFTIPNDSTFLRGVSTFTIELADSSGGNAIPTASTSYDLGALHIDLPQPETVVDSMRSWEARRILGGTTPTFVIRAPFGGGVAGFQAGNGAFTIRYHLASAPTVLLTVTSRAIVDFYTRTPLTPLPTGTDVALLMGGRYETMIAIRATIPTIPAGYSLNEATWLLRLDGIEDALEDNAFIPDKTYLDVDVFRIGSSWSESATDTLGMMAGVAIPALRLHKVDPATDSTLVFPIPLAWIRGWTADSTTNHGILVAFTRWREFRTVGSGSVFVSVGADISPAIRVRSRETAEPPQLRISWTSPPPSRI
jgi:hypothetical protein